MHKQPYHRWRVTAFVLTVTIGSLIVLTFLILVASVLAGLVMTPFA
ncbi:hypothetical protein [Lentzea cavernae]|uniref:Uncharacterized protein n=1 Tax=Lentzea cavernae TaxID=2020703 RepID=A0ABQ3MU17_9PSEU|nr:hypothetical protein [Lentzea cavernae]GHH57357.1 hypothetical protein GCM10017774_76710 [Lentzea cavernae]